MKSVAAVKTPLETRKEGADSIFEANIDLRQRARLIAIYHSHEDKHRWMGWVDGDTHWLRADGPWLFGWTHARIPALRANDGVLVVDRAQGVLRLLLANRMPHDPSHGNGDLCDVKAKGLSLVLRFEDDEGHCRGITRTLRMKEIEQVARADQKIAP